MSSIYLTFIFLSNLGAINLLSVKEVFRKDGDANVAVILRNRCNSTTLTASEQSLVDSAIWTVHQLNSSENDTMGVAVYKTCNENEEYQTLFELFQRKQNDFLLGLITTSKLPKKILKFCDALDLAVRPTVKCTLSLAKAGVALLNRLNWVENVTVIAPDDYIVQKFAAASRENRICLQDYEVYDSAIPPRNSTSGYLVIFGNHSSLSAFIKDSEISNAILVALDGLVLNDLPENVYLVTSEHTLHNFNNGVNFFTPNPQVLEIAFPLVSYIQGWKLFVDSCNETNYQMCLKDKSVKIPRMRLEPAQVVDLLKIETSSINYTIFYKSGNASLGPDKVFTYNIFDDNLTQVDSGVDFDNRSPPNVLTCDSTRSCQKYCKNFDIRSPFNFISGSGDVRFRTEAWVYAFLSLSLLGVLLCIAILIFLLLSICRRNVLEGNPVLTLLLLLTIMLMYCSILPLSLEGNHFAKEAICITRALSITLSFTAAFSLILSRSILLATATKEIGFMSHVPGPVQAFLCLFIFGVQAALSLQVVNNCVDIFNGYSFVYLSSYNIMLLLLLLCLCPLIFKSQRNYKEGKYFTVAAVTITLLWCIWVPAYAFLEEKYKDPVLCFALVSTASAFLGTIFVPRTYLMTIAAAREKITNALPSMAAATSAMDIYRAGAQPVYDCVNVAAINAVTVARAGITSIQQPDLYSCPNLPEDDDFDQRCDSPINDDKVTRF